MTTQIIQTTQSTLSPQDVNLMNYAIKCNFKDVTHETLIAKFNFYKTTQEATLTNILNNNINNFENTLRPLILTNNLLELVQNYISYVSQFYPDKELLETSNDLLDQLKKYDIDLNNNLDLYNKIKQYYNSNYQQEKYTLTQEEVKYVEQTMRDYKREGLGLNNLDLLNYKKRISELETMFELNINNCNTSINLTREQLTGVPESWFTLDKLITLENIYKTTLKSADYTPILEYCTNQETRKLMYLAYNTRCPENKVILEELITLRYFVAKILNYDNFADYVTEIKIIKSSKNALSFLENLNKMFGNLYDQEREDLLKFAKLLNKNLINLELWDIAYYTRIYTEQECNINLEELKTYFPLERVVKNTLSIYENLLSLVFTEVETENKWHEDVKLYEVRDKVNKSRLGYFYTDLYPRPQKFSHAAVFDLVTGHSLSNNLNNNMRQPHVVALVCNFPKLDNLSFDNVETFFHEFGHVMHQLCSKSQLREYSSFNVENDFVEAPSQMLENWVYTQETLKLLTDNQINLTYIDKLKKKKNFFAASFTKRQLMYGLLDLNLHMTTFDNINSRVDLQQVYDNISSKVLNINKINITKNNITTINPVLAFGHIAGGYAAGYYGYMLSLDYATNMFYKVFKNNELNPKLGLLYRQKILEPGATKDGLTLLEDFLGEKRSSKYFLLDQGIEEDENNTAHKKQKCYYD
jgi:thimet oligopeptidase